MIPTIWPRSSRPRIRCIAIYWRGPHEFGQYSTFRTVIWPRDPWGELVLLRQLHAPPYRRADYHILSLPSGWLVWPNAAQGALERALTTGTDLTFTADEVLAINVIDVNGTKEEVQ